MTAPVVMVSGHARDQAARRHPDTFTALDPVLASRLIEAEVKDAVRNGRRSEARPGRSSWLTRPAVSYVWSPNCDRVYALRESGGRLFVLTTLPGFADERAA